MAAHAVLKKEFEADKSVVLTNAADPAAEIRVGTLDALVEFIPPNSDLPIDNNFATRITYDESRDRSNRAKGRIDQKISRYRDTYLEQQAAKLGLSREQFQNLRNVVAAKMTRAQLEAAQQLAIDFIPAPPPPR